MASIVGGDEGGNIIVIATSNQTSFFPETNTHSRVKKVLADYLRKLKIILEKRTSYY